MKQLTALITILFSLILVLPSGELFGQDREAEDGKLRIIAFGAHPDDCEISAAGVGAMWAAEGHVFQCVSMTNGDIGHFGMSGGELALRRMKEVEAAADILYPKMKPHEWNCALTSCWNATKTWPTYTATCSSTTMEKLAMKSAMPKRLN